MIPRSYLQAWTYKASSDMRLVEQDLIICRALLQRRKNRDLFDLGHGLDQLGLDAAKVVAIFDHYLALEAAPICALAELTELGEKMG